MTDRRAHGFLLSATLHILIVAAVWLMYSWKEKPDPVKIFELVAGAGDNYLATEAPALGSPDSVKIDIPVPPTPASTPPAPIKAEPTPLTAAPPVKQVAPKEIVPAKPVEKAPAPKKEVSIAKDIRNRLWRAESRAKAEVKKQREAEAKKQREAEAQEKKQREAEQKRMTKAEFDRLNRAKATKQTKAPPAKIAKIDTKGIARGVVGGSRANTVGGAGGNALTAAEGDAIERYVALLQERLKAQLDQTPGLEDGLRAEAELHIMPDGRLTRAQIVKSSGNETFDLAVLRAIRVVRMPPRPKGLEQIQVIPFATLAKE